MSANDPRLHFGLGKAASIRGVGVLWPGSRPEFYEEKQVNKLVVLQEWDKDALGRPRRHISARSSALSRLRHLTKPNKATAANPPQKSPRFGNRLGVVGQGPLVGHQGLARVLEESAIEHRAPARTVTVPMGAIAETMNCS